jgi:ferritin-like metal-binding protein YciE
MPTIFCPRATKPLTATGLPCCFFFSTLISFPMNQLKTMRDLLANDIQMMYSAETQALEGLATLGQSATEPKIKEAFRKHATETQRQVARLEEIMATMDLKPSREVCSGIQGMLADVEKLLRKESTPEVLDAMLIAAAQKMEHFEIACYGTAVRMTEDLGLTQASELLRQTLEEEKRTDELLTQIAERRVNVKAEAS